MILEIYSDKEKGVYNGSLLLYHYQQQHLAILSTAMSVLEPRLTDEGLYLIPDLVCEASFPLREAAPYFLSCSAL